MRISRRDFLRAAGATAAVATLGGPVLGFGRPEVTDALLPAAASPDRIADMASALGYDAESIFRFVADEIRYDPYPGILRGAHGTLAGRAGNSVDQALLLAALLDASLIDHRFAKGELDAATAGSILEASVTGMDEIRQHAIDAIIGVVPGQPLRPLPSLDPEAAALMERAVASADAVVAWAQDDLARTVSTITDALAAEGIDLPVGFTPFPDRERLDHTWIQMDSGNEWIDLDPVLPGADLGVPLTAAAVTFEALAEELAHRVDLAVIAERVSGGSLVEELLLLATERADVLAGQPIVAFSLTPEGLSSIASEAEVSLSGMRTYLPALRLGEDIIVGLPYGFGLRDVGDGVLGSAFPEGETTALWLESTITAPDREPTVVRRPLFDRVGPAARAGGSFDTASLTRAATIDLEGRPPGDVIASLGALWLAVGGAMPAADSPSMNSSSDELAAGGTPPAVLHLLREAAAQELAVPGGVRPFPDAPNVNGLSMMVTDAPDGPVVELALDILHRSLGVAPVTALPAVGPPGVMAGVLVHTAERILMGDALAARPTTSDGLSVSVGRVFESAAGGGLDVVVLRDPAAVAALGYPAEARAVLERSLAEGWVAVAPPRAVELGGRDRAGWWLVDPATGRTVDQLDDGRGSALQYLETTKVSRVSKPSYTRLSCVTAALAWSMGLFLAGAALQSGNWSGVLSAGGFMGIGGVLGREAWKAKACR